MEIIIIIIIITYLLTYLFTYLLQLSLHSVAVFLTLTQTNPGIINIYKRNNTKHSTNNTKHSKYKYSDTSANEDNSFLNHIR